METADKNISRRNFIRLSGLSGAALTIGLYTPLFGKEISDNIITGEAAENLGVDLNAWISIDTAGKVTITNHRAEMGQG